MNLHEYQAKALFAEFGMPVSAGQTISSPEEAEQAARQLGGTDGFMVKAQVHAGGRGKAGGVKFVKTPAEAAAVAKTLLGNRLVTYQTDARGQPVHQILIEVASNIAKELYLGAVVDRATQRVIIMASTEGGVDIETVADKTPEKIIKIMVDPLVKVMPYQCREVAFALGLNEAQSKQLAKIMMGLCHMFMRCDLSLVEINPLIITTTGDLRCLDGKVVADDNALFRQPKISAMRDKSQEDDRENRAKEWDLNYVPLEGNIGCMVNGAGLAMATMDIIQLHGGKPANFLDVGGGATRERVTEAFKIILSDPNVKAILVNIFGGIVRCTDIAAGIIEAVKGVGIQIPVVVRLEGNQAVEASRMLGESGLNITAATGLTDAADKVVKAVGASV
jgi:succinyl-CoA synthetase beta subunit